MLGIDPQHQIPSLSGTIVGTKFAHQIGHFWVIVTPPSPSTRFYLEADPSEAPQELAGGKMQQLMCAYYVILCVSIGWVTCFTHLGTLWYMHISVLFNQWPTRDVMSQQGVKPTPTWAINQAPGWSFQMSIVFCAAISLWTLLLDRLALTSKCLGLGSNYQSWFAQTLVGCSYPYPYTQPTAGKNHVCTYIHHISLDYIASHYITYIVQIVYIISITCITYTTYITLRYVTWHDMTSNYIVHIYADTRAYIHAYMHNHITLKEREREILFFGYRCTFPKCGSSTFCRTHQSCQDFPEIQQQSPVHQLKTARLTWEEMHGDEKKFFRCVGINVPGITTAFCAKRAGSHRCESQ